MRGLRVVRVLRVLMVLRVLRNSIILRILRILRAPVGGLRLAGGGGGANRFPFAIPGPLFNLQSVIQIKPGWLS